MSDQDIPKNHPRRQSLLYRKAIEDGVSIGVVASAGPIAHGRGEAFDYLLGEETPHLTYSALQASAAMLLLAKHPVISVNGNCAVLAAKELVKLAEVLPALLEVNIFYGRVEEREQKIADILIKAGAGQVLGVCPNQKIPLLTSARGKVDEQGIFKADVVLVMLEDGDRTEYLRKAGKKVIAIDLNPLSRTPQKANIALVDNITRAIPLLTSAIEELRKLSQEELETICRHFDNVRYLKEVLRFMATRITNSEMSYVSTNS